MQNYQTQHVHSREAATGYQTCEKFCFHRHVSNPLLEQTFRPYQAHCWALNLCLPGMFIPPHSAELTRNRMRARLVTRCPSRGCGFRGTQVRQVSKDDLMEWFLTIRP